MSKGAMRYLFIAHVDESIIDSERPVLRAPKAPLATGLAPLAALLDFTRSLIRAAQLLGAAADCEAARGTT